MHEFPHRVIFWTCSLLMSADVVAAEGTVRRILLVHSLGRDFAPFSEISASFRTELSRLSPQPVEFFETSLELTRFDGSGREEPLVAYLESVFNGQRPDLVVPIGAPALMFYHRNRERLFPNVPTLVVGAAKRRIIGTEGDPWITSVHFDNDLPGYADAILQLLPDLRHIYVVHGAAPLDRYWADQLRREWPPVLDGVEIHLLGDKALPEIQDKLARLPAHSAVFHGIMTLDAAGVPQEHENALAAVRQASRAPVFGYCEEQLGIGIVGGSLVSMRECGFVAAGVAVRLLAGENPAAIHTPPLKAGTPKYDWRELKHWKIPLSRLPANSTILHRPPGLWQNYSKPILATAAALVLQSIMIVLLANARRRARNNEENLRLATEAARIGLWYHKIGEADEIHASPEWCGLFDLPDNRPLSPNQVVERIHPADRAMVREVIDRAPLSNGDSEIEYRIVRADGEVRWISSRWRAGRENAGRRALIRGASIDITDRKHAEAELAARSEEMIHLNRVTTLGELSGVLAHELNQPLGAILSNAQTALRMLARNEVDQPVFHDILSDIVAEDQRAANVIKRLRALLERGETSPQPLDPHHCIDEVLALLKSKLKEREVVVSRQFADNLPMVHADPIQLQQVMLNLLGNACDATANLPPGERHITVRTGAGTGHVFVEVQDNGTGFSGEPEDCFQPFHTTKPGGLGMGLAICKSVIAAHHGEITAVSPPGGGATVRFTLPSTPPT